MKTKLGFIKELLESKLIPSNQREKIFELASKELGLDSNLENRVEKIENQLSEFREKLPFSNETEIEYEFSKIRKKVIVSIDEDREGEIIRNPEKPTIPDTGVSEVKLDINYINPLDLYNALLAYNQDPILKTTCHPMSTSNIEYLLTITNKSEYDFNNHLEAVKFSFERFSSKYSLTSKMYSLIKGYLYGGKAWSGQNILFSWNDETLKEWSKNNPKMVPNPEVSLAELNSNEGFRLLNPFISDLTGQTVESFNDLVIFFKSLWHIKKDNPLQQIIEKQNMDKNYGSWANFHFVNFSQTTNLYTDVDKLIQAYREIIKLIKENSSEGRQDIELSFFENDSKKIFSIYQRNTIWNKSVSDTVERPFGNDFPPIIKNQINGLCDLHIEARFENNSFYHVNLWDGKQRESNPIDEIDGVKYLLILKK
jgi:hypothetical protein